MTEEQKQITEESEQILDLNKLNTLCANLRKAKILYHKSQIDEAKWKTALKPIAEQHGLKGDYNGIKIVPSLSFANSNLKIAESNKIEVKYNLNVNLDQSRIKELMEKGILKQDEVIKTPDLKDLEDKMAKSKIVCEYEVSYSFRLATE